MVVERREKNGLTKPFCENAWLSDSMRKYYLLGLVVLQYFLPLIILTGAYVRMATRLWGATAPGNAEDTRDAAILRNKKRVIKMLAVVVLVFALCWLPLQTYNFFQSFIPAINNYQYINIIWFSFHWLAMSNSMYNPFIYAIYNDKFQREFRSRLRCMSICSGNRADSPCSELSDFDRSKVRASYRFHDVRQRNGGAGNGEGHGSSKHHSHHHHHNHSYRCQRLSHNRLNSSTRGKRNCVTAFEEENENQQNRLVGNANHINCYNNVVSPPACRTQSQTPDKIIWKRNGQDFTTECVDVEMDADLQSKLTIL